MYSLAGGKSSFGTSAIKLHTAVHISIHNQKLETREGVLLCCYLTVFDNIQHL